MTDAVKQNTDERTLAQFFFEVGYGACFADAYIRNGNVVPFQMTDAIVERAWEIAAEAHEDPEEFDRYLALADSAALSTRFAESAKSPSDSVREALEPFAKLAEQYDPPENDDELPIMRHDGDELNIGHLRAARAALQSSEADNG
jgi:hypothetical protein